MAALIGERKAVELPVPVPGSTNASEVAGDGPRPIFVVGSLRSGASLLTLCLGQHSHLLQTLETRWFERFALGLQQAYAAGISPRETSQLDIARVELEEFFAAFGPAIDRLMLRPHGTLSPAPTRWMDGSHTNANNLFALLRIFPDAQVIHVLREASEVVATLTNKENRRHYKSRQILMSEEEAVNHWLETVTACVDAERAFGSATILRVRRRELVERSETTLRSCLAFLGEPFEPACLRPFRSAPDATGESAAGTTDGLHGIPADLEPPTRPRPIELPRSVALMSYLLNAEETPSYPRDEGLIARLEAVFADQSAREARLLGGPKRIAARRASAKSVESAKSPAASATIRRNGQLFVRVPDLGRFFRGGRSK